MVDVEVGEGEGGREGGQQVQVGGVGQGDVGEGASLD